MRHALGTAAAIVLGFTVAWPILDFLIIRQRNLEENTTSDSDGDAEDLFSNDGISSSSGTDDADVLTGTSSGETLTGKNGTDVLRGLGGDDILDGGRDFDQLFGGDGADTFLFRSTPEADKDRVYDAATDDIFGIYTSTGGSLATPFSGVLVDGDGDAADHVADAAKRDATVGTPLYVDEGPQDVNAAEVDVLLFYAGTGLAAGTDGLAHGLDGLTAALGAGTASEILNSASTPFGAGKKMVVVVENTTDNQIDVGLLEDKLGDGFDVGDVVETLFEIDITGGITAADVASQIDFLGLA